MFHLPDDIQEKILSRLPVKTLLRFRSVCRSWNALIDSNSVQNKHYSVAKRLFSTSLIWRKSPFWHDPFIDFLSVDHPQRVAISIDLPSACEPLYFWKFGVANGLLCLVSESSLVICNPSTKKFRSVEPPPNHWVSELRTDCGIAPDVRLTDGRHRVSAFGFDPSTEDYKFMMAVFTTHKKVFLRLYSLQNDSWKALELDFPYSFTTRLVISDGYLDVKFHWFSKGCRKEDGGCTGPAIINFNFTEESFEVIPLVRELALVKDSIVVANRGCLELITTFGEGAHRTCEIWGTSKEGQWSRKSNISLSPFPQVVAPRGVTTDGRLVFESRGDDAAKEISVTDPSTGSSKNLGPPRRQFGVFTFVESLFSVT